MTTDGVPAAAPVSRLVDEFHKLPGIGPKTAQRLTYHLVRMPDDQARSLAEAIVAVKDRIVLCSRCYNITESDPCLVCTDLSRDQTRVCVVEEALDVLAVERTHTYRGLYHVLHGVISPINGIGPDQLKLKELFSRLTREDISEMVVATNPTLEGEATAMYIRRHQGRDDLKVTHLARGLPVGGSLEYTDETTLTRAFQGRQEI